MNYKSKQKLLLAKLQSPRTSQTGLFAQLIVVVLYKFIRKMLLLLYLHDLNKKFFDIFIFLFLCRINKLDKND